MSSNAANLGNRVWSHAGVLRDDGLSYLSYVEQITFLLFLKMADELSRPPYNRGGIIPEGFGWQELVKRDGDELEVHYRHTLETLGKQPGLLGVIFRRAKNEITDPAKLRRLIVDLIDPHQWVQIDVDVKGTVYEELLSRSATESTGGAGQYFTYRPIIQAVVDVMRPGPRDSIIDPAAGTGGFLFVAHDYVQDHHGKNLDRDEKKRVKEELIRGVELVPNTARLCAMNLYLHNIGRAGEGESPIESGVDSLASSPSREYSMVLTNPPFGKKQTLQTVNDEGAIEREDQVIVRQDFWASTGNKQLNFLQHIYTLLEVEGKAAVVVPDNVLFEGGAGEKIRNRLLKQCDCHTLLRLPTGIFYKPGVKANVLFFDKKPGREKPWTEALWVYDLRTNKHFTLKQNPIKRSDFDDFVACFNAEQRHKREATWSEQNPEGRWRRFGYDELVARDKLNLDLFWLKDDDLMDGDDLPAPEVLAAEIVEDLQAALDQFSAVAGSMAAETD